MVNAIYPGSFDPITNGHLDIINRTRKLYNKLFIVINENINKKTFFSIEERKQLVEECVKGMDNVEVIITNKLTVEVCKELNAQVIIRGLRMVSDFEYELQMSSFNRILDSDVETIFIMADHNYSFLSSSSVKEIVLFGGNISRFVPKNVELALRQKIKS